MVKNLLAKAGDTGSVPDLGRSHVTRRNEARAPKLLRNEARAPKLSRHEARAPELSRHEARAPELLSQRATVTTVLAPGARAVCATRSHCSEKPLPCS